MKIIRKVINILFVFCLVFFGCEEDVLEKPEPLEITLEATDCSAYGVSDGSVTSAIRGGRAPFSYIWSNGATSANLTSVPAGAYSLKIIYGNSGVAEAHVVVGEPDGALTVETTVSDATWFGGDDGSINITLSDGIAPYTFVWDHDSEETGSAISGLTAGSYNLAITDSSPKPITKTLAISVSQPEFVCGLDSITDVDGNKYPTVQIGDQCWTAANLRTTHNPLNPEELIAGRFCKDTNCGDEFGAHYTWDAIMNGAESADGETEIQGICPDGWHLPTRTMWQEFDTYLSIDGNAGSGINVPNKIRGAGSSSGFDALYAGNWGYDVFIGDLAAFWTSTLNENKEGHAYFRLVNSYPLLGEGHEDLRSGLSCRCVKDE